MNPNHRAGQDPDAWGVSFSRCMEFKFISDRTVVNSLEILTLWLNGYEYHRDEENRAEFEALHDGAQPLMAHSRTMFAAMMLDRARAVLDVGNAIFALRANVAVTPFRGDIPLGAAWSVPDGIDSLKQPKAVCPIPIRLVTAVKNRMPIDTCRLMVAADTRTGSSRRSSGTAVT